jgi:hypothetical protein
VITCGFVCLTAITSQVKDLETTVNGLMGVLDAIQSSVGTIGTTVDGLGTTVDGLGDSISATNSATDALQDAIDNLPEPTDYSTELADLASGLADAQTAIASLTQQLAGVVTAADLATIYNTIGQVQADVRELLQSNAVVNQSINITNSAQLLLAESLIGTLTTDPNVIVNGFVNVMITSDNFTTAEIARVNAVTSKLATVLQHVTASSAASPSVAIEFPNLSFVDGNYTVSGNDANDPKLATISGDLNIGHGGVANYSQISSIGGNVVIDPSVTSINLTGATITGNVSSNGAAAGVIVLPKATAVNIGTAQVNTASLTLAEGVVNLGYEGTIANNVLIEAPKAGSIEFAAKTVTGTLMVTANGDTTIFNAANLTTASATTISAEEANFPKLTMFTGNSVITADTVTFPALTGNASGTLDLQTAESFVAPKFTISSNVSATLAKTVEFLSGSNTNLSAPAATSLTINEQGNTTNFDTTGYAGTLETFNITGKVNSSPTALNVTSVVTITGAKIKTASINGMIDSTIVASAGALTSLTTAGSMRILQVDNAAVLTSVGLGHDHINGSGAAQLHFTNNAELASVNLSSVSDVGTIQIENNAKLAAITAPATNPLTETVATIVATVTGNNLEGTYTKGTPFIPAVETTPAVAAVQASISQASVYSLRLWLEAHYSHVASPTFNIQIDALDSDDDGAFDDGDYAAVAGVDINNTADDGANQIDIPAELATIKQ